ncbi:MAG: hypothetical protein ABW140_10715 [Candidatus Sedimenticola sp. 6PFRAG1]
MQIIRQMPTDVAELFRLFATSELTRADAICAFAAATEYDLATAAKLLDRYHLEYLTPDIANWWQNETDLLAEIAYVSALDILWNAEAVAG